ncbi:hypothetical protein FHS82_003070 [Pseudochelatococcus lubricantis]|uniref:AAA domain-containing protein n=1 Tax=Pseudochelatococcus lubricantis TaxID=1538102 RepID=A0ABX0V604_9HYPH|nr:AAA family ATPase [Pseudochelatococcus lubricantis]NIJ59215.1 hypothetical protein [Pseudochelatococcus lubricantis]
MLEAARMSADADLRSSDARSAAEPMLAPDQDAIALFIDRVFGYCDGLIPVRGLAEKGSSGRPHTAWIEADRDAAAKILTSAIWAAREGAALYVVPGTVAETGKAKAEDVRQIQTIVVDLDSGDVEAKLSHLRQHLPPPVIVVESGGRTETGAPKLHVWWRLNEPAEGTDVDLVCALRGLIADKVGGDPHFRSAHQPIRVAGSVYFKGGASRLVAIRESSASEIDLREFADAVEAMPALPGLAAPIETHATPDKPTLDDVLSRRTRAGGVDPVTRFEAASMAIGHHVRLVHEGRETEDEARRAIQEFNQACLDPPWPPERIDAEFDRLWRRHVARNGPGLTLGHAPVASIPAFTLGALIDDKSPMPADIIAPRVLTPGGMLVLGGAPKVGKSDFLISLLAHMAAGAAFLCFKPPRPLRVFYLQAEIDYHYLRERLQGLSLPKPVLAIARDNLVVTPKLRLILDGRGLGLVEAAILGAFESERPDILCIDPIRNLFDGGPDGGGENDNDAMLFFLQARVEALRNAAAPDAGLILCHHTRKAQKKQIAEDPFQALAGASALRGFYSAGILMHRPDEERPERRLEFELRNGPAIDPILIDKRQGRWIMLDPKSERLVRKDLGERLDAERARKRDVILDILDEQARAGHLYTALQFAEAFENQAGLGGRTTIRERVSVLATKGYVKFTRDGGPYGLPNARSKLGYLVIEGMQFPSGESVDADTGEVTPAFIPVLPTHYKAAQTGAVLDVENPFVWVYPEGETP